MVSRSYFVETEPNRNRESTRLAPCRRADEERNRLASRLWGLGPGQRHPGCRAPRHGRKQPWARGLTPNVQIRKAVSSSLGARFHRAGVDPASHR